MQSARMTRTSRGSSDARRRPAGRAASRARHSFASAWRPDAPPRSSRRSASFEDEELEARGRIEHDLRLIGEHSAAQYVRHDGLELVRKGGLEGDARLSHEV